MATDCTDCKHVSSWSQPVTLDVRTAYCMYPLPFWAQPDQFGAYVMHDIKAGIVRRGNTPVVNCPAWEQPEES